MQLTQGGHAFRQYSPGCLCHVSIHSQLWQTTLETPRCHTLWQHSPASLRHVSTHCQLQPSLQIFYYFYCMKTTNAACLHFLAKQPSLPVPHQHWLSATVTTRQSRCSYEQVILTNDLPVCIDVTEKSLLQTRHLDDRDLVL